MGDIQRFARYNVHSDRVSILAVSLGLMVPTNSITKHNFEGAAERKLQPGIVISNRFSTLSTINITEHLSGFYKACHNNQ